MKKGFTYAEVVAATAAYDKNISPRDFLLVMNRLMPPLNRPEPTPFNTEGVAKSYYEESLNDFGVSDFDWENGDPEDEHNRNCPYCGGEFWNGGHSCTCDEEEEINFETMTDDEFMERGYFPPHLYRNQNGTTQ